MWALTIVFAGVAAWFLVRCLRTDRVTNGAHAVMGIGMAWGMSMPMWLQVAVFGPLAIWFAGLATVPYRAHGFRALHHSFMAASMLWMSLPSIYIVGWYFLAASVPLARGADGLGHAAMSAGTGIMLLSMM